MGGSAVGSEFAADCGVFCAAKQHPALAERRTRFFAAQLRGLAAPPLI